MFRLDWSNDFYRNLTRRTSLIQGSESQADTGRSTRGGPTLACRKVAVDGYSLIGVEREAWSVRRGALAPSSASLATIRWFGQGLLTRPSSAPDGLTVPDRWRVTWRRPVGRMAIVR